MGRLCADIEIGAAGGGPDGESRAQESLWAGPLGGGRVSPLRYPDGPDGAIRTSDQAAGAVPLRTSSRSRAGGDRARYDDGSRGGEFRIGE